MWQTVSEINGTNALDQTDPWHEKVNAYFVSNDPYRHPTTASGSGEVDWAAGHMAMDVPQVHLYEWHEDAVGATSELDEPDVGSSQPNWSANAVDGNTYYPELFHNSIWAALASGAAMMPAEWRNGGSWGRMTPEMNADISQFASLSMTCRAEWNPSGLITSIGSHKGLAGNDGGLFWVQDFSLEGSPIDEVRSSMQLRRYSSERARTVGGSYMNRTIRGRCLSG
jgi:hypothetical protein